METSELYDFVIVGGGMIGSSAAKHAAKICSEKNINARIALMGLAEEGKLEWCRLQGVWKLAVNGYVSG